MSGRRCASDVGGFRGPPPLARSLARSPPQRGLSPRARSEQASARCVAVQNSSRIISDLHTVSLVASQDHVGFSRISLPLSTAFLLFYFVHFSRRRGGEGNFLSGFIIAWRASFACGTGAWTAPTRSSFLRIFFGPLCLCDRSQLELHVPQDMRWLVLLNMTDGRTRPRTASDSCRPSASGYAR